jgi:hypothetical protein
LGGPPRIDAAGDVDVRVKQKPLRGSADVRRIGSEEVDAMRKRTVKLHGHHCEISVHREGKHVWIAVGDYLGKEIRAQAESEGAAVKRWREMASQAESLPAAG